MVPDMQIKPAFKEKTKIMKKTLKNGMTMASPVVLVEVEELDAKCSSIEKSAAFEYLL